MLGFVLRRIAMAIPVILILIVFSFVLMRAAPGGPFTKERALPPVVLENINAKYGLDDPFLVQIGTYLKNIVFHFDFGPSFVYQDRTVNQIIAEGFPVTLTYGFWSFVLAVVIGGGLGILAALKQNTWLDYLAVGFSIGAQAMPNFIMAPILVLIFTLGLGWLPGGGWYTGPGDPNTYSAYLVMPVIALSTSYLASIARLTRSSMLEVLHSNFIRTARAKGLPNRVIIFRHTLKPALIPVISYLGPAFVGMITGSVVVDMFLSTGGIGKDFVQAALNRDYSVIMGITILVGMLTILFNLIVDVLYAWIDPRIRY
ncbi:oligopeptide ABC transporter permease OppB [Aliiroseovarius sp. F20344]|uniref:oligopeptide ABC transporter permease OppB n=1 Tax=Aliiroseovarius sp. F20344 TaxID=2926414 RepID=UPI001FF38C24|nr:oligopeptide ABC transporter permease OppB [Aliiroseovarius sp. F20344]MCK0141828.1 oligopeptide ABC transporter permease OppB [Aliiroseovarius sp. F20344]